MSRFAFRPGVRHRSVAAIALCVVATLAGQLVALSTFRQAAHLSVATIRLSVSPGQHGALALYVPLVDWGVRYDAVRLPAELRVDVRSIDRGAAQRVAQNQRIDVARVRSEARDAIASYLRKLLLVVLVSGLLAGVVVALAVRSRSGPSVRRLVGSAVVTAVLGTALLAVTLPPRGALDEPEYFAHGADIPKALEAVESVSRTQRNLSEELNAQLVGLARLVIAPGARNPVSRARQFVLASDIHNNVAVLPSLARAADGLPLFLAGDLTDRGSPVETDVTERVADAGHPLVFVSGNHDSDTLELRLAKAGAIVLTRHGQLLPDGRYGDRVVRVGGLRVAGYDDPFARRAGRRYVPTAKITEAQRLAFATWLNGLGAVDVVMVHEPDLTRIARRYLRAYPPKRPLILLVGHTHKQSLATADNVVEINGGTAGGGGTGNLTEDQDIGLAIVSYRLEPTFLPLAADLVSIEPESGAAKARHEPLDLAP
ncbi:MAG TPA: metallophosphoesterase [Solirubrobacteraceae bacterium]|nr:metallophosphoesterase [Solirubrobacteraceae bacterium]